MNEFGHQKEKQNIIISDVKSRKPYLYSKPLKMSMGETFL